MAIIPTMRCSRLRKAFDFYTKILDFKYVGGDDLESEDGFLVLAREGDEIFLCSFDGGKRSVIAIMVDDVDAVFRKFRERGLKTPGNPDQPVEVHERQQLAVYTAHERMTTKTLSAETVLAAGRR